MSDQDTELLVRQVQIIPEKWQELHRQADEFAQACWVQDGYNYKADQIWLRKIQEISNKVVQKRWAQISLKVIQVPAIHAFRYYRGKRRGQGILERRGDKTLWRTAELGNDRPELSYAQTFLGEVGIEHNVLEVHSRDRIPYILVWLGSAPPRTHLKYCLVWGCLWVSIFANEVRRALG